MGKNKNKNLAAVNAAKKPKAETKVEATKEEVKVEPVAEKKEEIKQPEVKKEEKKDAPKKTSEPQSKEKPKKEKKIPEFIPEEVHEEEKEKKAVERASKLNNIPIGSSTSSADGKAMLAYVMHERYGKNEELRKNYPELYQDLCRNIDVVTLLALVDVRQDLLNRGETGQLKLNIGVDQLMPLKSMADLLGIELAPAKALPGGNSNQLEIDFMASKVPEELSKDAGKSTNEKPELDPNKITTEEQIKEALSYLLCSNKNVAIALVNTVEWYRTLRMMQETNADKKLAMDDKTAEDWINEIFTLVKPVSLISGLGRSLYLYTSQLGSPIFSHALLHNYISKVGWSEEQIASILKALVQENVRLILKDDEKNPLATKALEAVAGSLGSKYIDNLFIDANIDVDKVAEDKKNTTENIVRNAKKILGVVRTNYFSKEQSPTEDELRMKIGQIINLYRDPANRLAEYCQPSITHQEVGEYPKTEKKS